MAYEKPTKCLKISLLVALILFKTEEIIFSLPVESNLEKTLEKRNCNTELILNDVPVIIIILCYVL